MVLTFQSATSSRSSVPIDLQYLFWRSSRLPDEITGIQGFYNSIGGKPVIEKTAAGKVTGDKSKKLNRVDVRFSFKGFASVRASVVTLSGSVKWEKTYEALVKLVPEIKSLTFKLTNTAVKFNLKKALRLEYIQNQIRALGLGIKAEYEPEAFAGLRLKFKDGTVANVFANGTVTAQGKNLNDFEKNFRDLLEKTITNPYKIGARERSASPVAARKNLAAKRAAITENRYERANNWNNARNGYYVRPGPNKVARFYKVPKNPALVRTKVVRAYANLGVNIPAATRRLLGISTNSIAPPKSAVRKAPINWNTSPPTGMYVRPGPGGLPKLYKIPKLVKQGKKTVLSTYKRAAVRIPNRVRAIFGISPSPELVKTPSPKLTGNVSNKGIFRIDGLDCMRYKLQDLKRIAEKLDIPSSRRTKEKLCSDIRSKLVLNVGGPKPNFTKNGVRHYILVNSRTIKRNSRTKAMNSFKVQEIKNFIKELNKNANVNGKTKKQLLDLLIERKRMMNLLNQMSFSFSSSSSQSPGSGPSSGSSSSSRNRGSPPDRMGLNIARDILGPGFTNAELQNFLNKYTKSPGSLNRIISNFKSRKGHSSGSSSSSRNRVSPPGRAGLNIGRDILGPGFTNAELQNFLNKYTKSPGSLNRIISNFKSRKGPVKLARANVESM
jgi:hypothetical protein